MPPIQYIKCEDGLIEFMDKSRTKKVLVASDIPADKNTIAKIESWINNDWIPLNVSGYQMQVHIISKSPLRATIYTANNGEKIPDNWWLE